MTQTYNDEQGSPIVQRGLINTQATVSTVHSSYSVKESVHLTFLCSMVQIDWLVQQQGSGAIAEELSELTLMGSSAGSLGVQVWVSSILKQVKHKTAVVLPDSYIGTIYCRYPLHYIDKGPSLKECSRPIPSRNCLSITISVARESSLLILIASAKVGICLCKTSR